MRDKEKAAIENVKALLDELIPEIGDEYRATDNPDDNEPGMMVTIASNTGHDWTYQTGDNSYMGSCYHKRFWGVGHLYRNTDTAALAEEMVNEVYDLIADYEENK